MKRFRIIVCILAMFILAGAVPVLADRYAAYEFDLSHIPAWGQDGAIEGRICSVCDTTTDEDLCVKLFLRLSEDDEWWPKPTYDRPYADVEAGYFGIVYNTGGDDVHAVEIALMAVRRKDAMLLDYDAADAAALCRTTIIRTPEGDISLKHSYRCDYPWLNEIGLDVGFYNQEGSRPGSPLTEEHIRAVLGAAAAYTENVRFYTTTGEEAKAYTIAKDLGLSVAATAWLDGSSHDQEELDALIELCNSGLASTAIVGNETLLSGTVPEDQLIRDIRYVREGIHDPEIPVTTSDTIDRLLDSEKVREVCDVLAPNIYPFWNGLTVEEAEEDLRSSLDRLIAVAGGKKILVSETGWPSDGSPTAGTEEQSINMRLAYDLQWQYYDDLYKFYWFDLADEPWKAETEGEAGAHWGILDKDLNAKPVIYEYYWNWSAENDFSTEYPEYPELS